MNKIFNILKGKGLIIPNWFFKFMAHKFKLMNKVLHSEDGFVVYIEEGFLKAKTSRGNNSIVDSLNDFRILKQCAKEASIDRVLIVFVETSKVPDNFTELFADGLSESEMSFFYDVKIALVSSKKYFKMFQLLIQYAKSLNVEMEVFVTMKKAKSWLRG